MSLKSLTANLVCVLRLLSFSLIYILENKIYGYNLMCLDNIVDKFYFVSLDSFLLTYIQIIYFSIFKLLILILYCI